MLVTVEELCGSWDDLTPNAYEEAWDGLAPAGGADEVINGFDANDQIRYTSPSMGGQYV